MLWKNRWTGGWFLRRAADQPKRARTQDNQILISAYDKILSRTSSYNCLMIGELPVRPRVSSPSVPGFQAQNRAFNLIRATFRHLIHRQLHDGSLTITDNQRKVLYGWHPPKDGIFNLRPLLRLPASHYER